jgi:hypothetical protein
MGGGFVVESGGKLHTIPLDQYPDVEPIDGRLPDHPVLVMDEDKFACCMRKHAVWCQGEGEFALLAYCGDELTITRWGNLEEAIQSKHMIDSSGCGGRCCRVHIIVQVDRMNSREARRQQLIDEYIEATREQGLPIRD